MGPFKRAVCALEGSLFLTPILSPYNKPLERTGTGYPPTVVARIGTPLSPPSIGVTRLRHRTRWTSELDATPCADRPGPLIGSRSRRES